MVSNEVKNTRTPDWLGDSKSRNESRNESRNDEMVASRNSGMAKSWKGGKSPQILKDGMTERRKIPRNPKRWNGGTSERLKITRNPKSWNGGKAHQILKDGTINPRFSFHSRTK